MKNKMSRVFFAAFLLCATTTKVSLAMESKFALICEWNNGTVGGSQTFRVDLANSTVDGKKAAISEVIIFFIKNAVEYRIDRISGVLDMKDLKATGIQLAGPVNRCKKVNDKQRF